MSDAVSDGEDERDTEWLFARERGAPRPPLPAQRSERYERLEALISELPVASAATEARSAWQSRVMAALDAAAHQGNAGGVLLGAPGLAPASRAQRRRSVRVVAAVTLALGAAVALVVGWRAASDRSRELLVAVVPASGEPYRSRGGAVGETLVARMVTPEGSELRVYDEHGVEQARCGAPPGPHCRREDSEHGSVLVLEMPVHKAGEFRVVWLSAALAGPSAGLDADLASAAGAGLAVKTPPPVQFH